MAVVPNVRAGRGVELPHVRKEAREVRATVQGGEDRGPRDVVVGANAVDADDCGLVIQGQPCSDRPCECLGTSPCGERKLVWCAGGVKRSAEGLGQRAGKEPAEGVAEHEAPDASVAFTQGDHSAEAKGVENRGWDRCIDELLRRPME